MYMQIIGAIMSWAVLFSIAWALNHKRNNAIQKAPEMNFFVWLAGVLAAVLGTLLALANPIAIIGAVATIIALAVRSWKSRRFRLHMRTVLIMAKPGIIIGIVGTILLHFGK